MNIPTFTSPIDLALMFSRYRQTRNACLFLCALFITLAPAVQAQVSVSISAGQVVIQNRGFQEQRAVKAASKNFAASRWQVLDNVGNPYAVGSYERGRDQPANDDVIVVGGYQRGRDQPANDDVIVVGGYQDALQYLRTQYGAVIEHDDALDVDLISLPNEADPIARFFEIISTDVLYGHKLIDFFRLIEIASEGAFDPITFQAAPSYGTLPFPDDTYFLNQWNLAYSRLLEAQWHPAQVKKQVKLAIIDSGIGTEDRGHSGLDGTTVIHEVIAPTTNHPTAHGLGVVSLISDGANDGDGIVGLMGDTWAAGGCWDRAPLMAAARPVIYSYNVGDFGPVSVYVARAIRDAIEKKVDVINLSLAIAYSPTVEAALEEALDTGIIVVAAAGNYDASARSKKTRFPANYQGVISVGSAGKNMTVSATSANKGIHILAPGEQIVVGGPGNVWYPTGGTSFAAPHVAVVAAMMRAVNPSVSPDQVRKALQLRGQRKGTDAVFLNALSSLNEVLPPSSRTRTLDLVRECVAGAFRMPSKNGQPVFPWDGFVYDSRQDDDLFAAEEVLPSEAVLKGNYPNPFNPATTLRFMLPDAGHVRLSVYNLLGQEVAVLIDGRVEGGEHDVAFDATHLTSGLYVARLQTAAGSRTHTMTLVK